MMMRIGASSYLISIRIANNFTETPNISFNPIVSGMPTVNRVNIFKLIYQIMDTPRSRINACKLETQHKDLFLEQVNTQFKDTTSINYEGD